ncbi:MAG TPA: replicative DNA helicase [Ktedonosporobacter sp.]|nr:replicative DNA helicase [Ktedonosporobacter sp.]
MPDEKAKSTEKHLPYSLDAEQAVLGSLTIDPEALALVADFLQPDDFYREAHRLIYSTILALSNQQVPADFITLSDELERLNKLEEVGGSGYICELGNIVPTSGNIEYYGRIVAQNALQRRMIHFAGEVAHAAYEEESDALEKAEQGLYALSRQQSSSFESIGDVMSVCFPKLKTRSDQGNAVIGVPTGFYALDVLLGGLQRSDLIILASRPGVGKTSLCLNIASNIAYGKELRVGIFSLEMSKEQLAMRLLSMHSGVNQQRLRLNAIEEEEVDGLVSAMATISKGGIFIDDAGGLSLTALRSRARRLKVEQKIDLLVIDYLQLMNATNREGKSFLNREQEIAEISRGLKALAKELDIPLLVLAQLSRAVEARQSKVPQLSDLRESGAIENDADIVLFLYREELYNSERMEMKSLADLHIAKHRNGPIGSVRLRFEASQTRFQNLGLPVDQVS